MTMVRTLRHHTNRIPPAGTKRRGNEYEVNDPVLLKSLVDDGLVAVATTPKPKPKGRQTKK